MASRGEGVWWRMRCLMLGCGATVVGDQVVNVGVSWPYHLATAAFPHSLTRFFSTFQKQVDVDSDISDKNDY